VSLLQYYIDDVATISFSRHVRQPVVTASTDYVAFLHPVRQGEPSCLTSCGAPGMGVVYTVKVRNEW